jgi:serine/threonine protein kinase
MVKTSSATQEKTLQDDKTTVGGPIIIGEGTYGCVHKPSLECKKPGVKYEDTVSKVLDKTEAGIEMKEYKSIDKVDKKHQFYLGKPVLCKPKVSSRNIRSIQKCDSIHISKQNQTAVRDLKNLSLIIMKYGGLNLRKYSLSIDKTKNKDKTKKQLMDLFIESRRILLGIQILEKGGIIHCDLKPQNIIYDEKTNRLNFIDFGLTTTTKKLLRDAKKSECYMSIFHWSYPFETEFYNQDKYDKFAAYNNIEKDEYYKGVIENIKTHNDDDKTSHIKTLLTYISDNTDYVNTHLQKYYTMLQTEIVPGHSHYLRFLNKSVSTIDSYGVGLSYCSVLTKCKGIINDDLYNDLYAFFINMVSPLIFERLTNDQLIIEYDMLLKKYNLIDDATVSITNANNVSSSKELSKDITNIIKSISHKNIKVSNNKMDHFTLKNYVRKSSKNKEYNKRIIKKQHMIASLRNSPIKLK